MVTLMRVRLTLNIPENGMSGVKKTYYPSMTPALIDSRYPNLNGLPSA